MIPDIGGDVANQCAGPFGAFYSVYIERPWLAWPIGRVIWGADLRPLYASINEEVAGLPDRATVIDVPCGAGLEVCAFRANQDVRFVAVDLEPKMLARTERRARARGLSQVELLQADMLALPFADATFDVALAYSGLHMVAEPQAAITEIARCVKPGGRIAGSTFVADGPRRQRALFAIGKQLGEAGLVMSSADLRGWLQQAGFADIDARGAGFVTFRAKKLPHA
jgi:ubiquinone/menaquinone biosynthesis C-methylase UbiE